MGRVIRGWVLVAIASVLLTGSFAIAGDKAKGRGDKPPSWGEGEKKGWKGDVHPGIEKKGEWLPPGLRRKEQGKWRDGRPPGWSRGEKEGWEGADRPPGLQEKEKGKGRKGRHGEE